jgi:hypothetical protein
LEIGRVSGLQFGERDDDRVRDCGHRGRIVPEMRIGCAIWQAAQMLHVDDLPPGLGRRRDHLIGPIIITQAVFHDEVGVRDLGRDPRADLEAMRIGVRVGLDRRHMHGAAADLGDHVGILVFHADGLDDLMWGRGRIGRCRSAGQGQRGESGPDHPQPA